MVRKSMPRGATLIAAALLVVLAAPAAARKFQMSGTWLMRQGGAFLPFQFAGNAGGGQNTHVSMGLLTEASLSLPDRIVSAVARATAMGASPAAVALAKHRFVRSHAVQVPLTNTMLVQLTTMFEIDAPYATATLEAGGGPGSFTWCPSNPACAAAGPVPGGVGNNGRVVYVAGANQFGGTMQMGLRGGGVISVKGAGLPPGVAGHLGFDGPGPALRRLAVGGGANDAPSIELLELAPGVLTAPVGGIPAAGLLITMPGPIVGMFPSITTPMGGMTGQFTTNWGFPHTTGTVLAQQQTGSGGDDFFAVMGSDLRTPLGAGNLNTVAGGLARQNTLGGYDVYAQFDRVSMTFGPPVPSLSPAGFATAGILLLLAAGHALRHRLA